LKRVFEGCEKRAVNPASKSATATRVMTGAVRCPASAMDPLQSTTRVRACAAIAGMLAVAAGVAVRHWLPWGFPSKYSGVALWSVVVYALVVFVRPRAGLARCAAVALFISWSVEFAQLTTVPGWLSSMHPVLRMIFGEHFSLGDLPAYAAGVLLAAIVHGLTVRPRFAPAVNQEK
jgi:hypothetical protein